MREEIPEPVRNRFEEKVHAILTTDIIYHLSFIIRYSLLVTGYWILLTGY